MGLLINGQVGWRTAAVIGAPAAASTLWTSVYGVWNADGTNNISVKNAWNANGDAVDSKSGVNGTIAAPSGDTWVPSTMTYGSGKLGSGAFTFNGNNFISLPNNSLDLVGDFTISLWAYIPSTTPMYLISTFDNSPGATLYNGWKISCQSNIVEFYVYNASGGYSTRYYGVSVPIPGINQWVHITVTKVVGQEANIYVNGVLGTKTITANGGGTSAMNPAYINKAYIGASYFFTRTPNAYNPAPNGTKIDAIQVWDGTALEQAAVTELYNSGNGQEYPFTLSNELIGTTNDATPNANNGTRPASTLTGGVPGPSFITGKIGKAFQFDGINDYVSLPNTSGQFNFTGDFTVSTWFRSSNLSASRYFMNNYQNNGSYWGYGWSFFYSSSLGFVFQLNNGAVNNQVNFLGGYSPNVWYHVVAVRTMGQKTKIYVNGVDTPATQSGSVSTAAGYIANQKMDLGGYSPLNLYALCDLDAVSFWNRALTQADVTDLYNTGTGKQYPN